MVGVKQSDGGAAVMSVLLATLFTTRGIRETDCYRNRRLARIFGRTFAGRKSILNDRDQLHAVSLRPPRHRGRTSFLGID